MNIDKLYREKLKAVYKFFYFKSFNQTIAEDLTSQTFLIMVEKMYDNDLVISDHTKFLYGIMRNMWLRYLQEKYQQQEQFIEDIEDFESYVAEELSREVQTSDEERVKRYVDQLPSSQQRVMTLRLVQKRSLDEICRLLGKDMNYVKTTQKRAIKNLHRLISGDQPEEKMI